MPSITVIYSPNLEGEFALDELTLALSQRAQSLGAFPAWGVRVFAMKADSAVVSDGNVELGYVQVNVRIAPGRLRDLQRTVTEELFDATAHILDKVTTRKIGYAVDLVEFDRLTYKSGGTLPGSPTAQGEHD